jgi:hypothetical protein
MSFMVPSPSPAGPAARSRPEDRITPDETQMNAASLSWTEVNFARHHAKPVRENPGCLEDFREISGRSMTVEEYGDRSDRPWRVSGASTGLWPGGPGGLISNTRGTFV